MGELEEQPLRVDRYLRLTEGDALGIKLREGRIEIKQRHRQYGTVRFRERVAGWVEGWRKWSFWLDRAQARPMSPTGPAESWIAVEKERRLRGYRVTAGGEVTALPAGQYAVGGCHVELTRVGVAGEEWWSLGLETFGDGPAAKENLLNLAVQILVGDDLPILEARDSYGYPEWLGLVAR
jgi:hypothetical protein